MAMARYAQNHNKLSYFPGRGFVIAPRAQTKARRKMCTSAERYSPGLSHYQNRYSGV